MSCFLCKNELTLTAKGQYCANCAKVYDPNTLPIPNDQNCALYDKLEDGRQNTCMKIFGPRNQHWYHCSTCFPTRMKGYCIHCARLCHEKKHKMTMYYCAFICDFKENV